jgi:hypothetical protein
MPDLSWRGIDKRTKPWHKRRLRGPTRERDDAGRFDRSPRPQPRSWVSPLFRPRGVWGEPQGTFADAGMGGLAVPHDQRDTRVAGGPVVSEVDGHRGWLRERPRSAWLGACAGGGGRLLVYVSPDQAVVPRIVFGILT